MQAFTLQVKRKQKLLQAKKAQMVSKKEEDEWGTGDLGDELLPQ